MKGRTRLATVAVASASGMLILTASFTCNKEGHTPIDCEKVKEWEKKCKDDSETANWIASNTKDCPKCGVPIEKNDG